MKARRAEARAPRGFVESVSDFVVVGWGVGVEGAPVDPVVTAGGRAVPATVQRHQRPDVRAAVPGASPGEHGLTIELDPVLWRLAPDPARLDLSLWIDGLALPLPELGLAQLDDWWARVAAEPASEQRERRLLRLFAHVAAAGGPGRLAPDAAAALERAAAERGLATALHDHDPEGRIARALRQQARLERFDVLAAQGWAADPALTGADFRVTANGVPVAARVERFDRPDVQHTVGAASARLGFRVELPAEIWAHAGDDGACAVALHVQGRALGEGPLAVAPADVRARLEALETAPVRPGPRELRVLEDHADALLARGDLPAAERARFAALLETLDPAGARAAPDAPWAEPAVGATTRRAALESWRELVVSGWVLDPAAGGELFRLQCNGHDVPCDVIRTTRGDVRAALGLPESASEFVGFELALPVDMWRHADAAGACAIVLRINGGAVPDEALRVDAALLEELVLRRFSPDAVRALRRADPAAVRERVAAWTVVRHVVASGAEARFSPAAREALAACSGWLEEARRHGLAESADAPALRRRVWRLQRRFNHLLGRPDADLLETLEAVLSDLDAVGAARTEFLLSVVPPLCENAAALARLQQALPLDVQALHAARGDNWHRSLYLVGLAAAGRFDDARAVLQRIADAPTLGWLNTECIAFALRHALTARAAGDAAAAGLVPAFVELLDALPGGWWSRAPDRRLVDTSARIAAALAGETGDAARRAIEGVLRHHGLTPSFWTRLAVLDVPEDATLARGRDDWTAARALVGALGAANGGASGATNGAADGATNGATNGAADGATNGGTHGATNGATSSAADGATNAAMNGDTDGGPAAVVHDDAWRDAIERLRVQHQRGGRDAARFLRERALHEAALARRAGAALDPAWRYVWEIAAPTELRRLAALPGEGVPAAESALWPTTVSPPDPQDPACPPDNRLALLSPPARLALADGNAPLVVCVVRNERVMLPHFLAHYRRLGVRGFVLVDNASDDGTAEYLLAQPDVLLYGAETAYRDSHYGVAWQQAVLAAHGRGRWTLLADADEMLLPAREGEPLDATLRRLDAAGHDAACVLMLDLYPRAALRDTDFRHVGPEAAGWLDREPLLRWRLGTGRYSNAPTWLSALRHRLIPHSPPNAFTAQKIALLRYRPWVRLSEGLHYAAELSPAPEPLLFGHYKYHADFRARVVQEVARKQHYDGASEYARYLDMVAEPDASLFAPDASIPLADFLARARGR